MARAESVAGRRIEVELVHAAAPHEVERFVLSLDAGATAADALRASGLPARLGEQGLGALQIGIWGRACAPDTRLRDGDRVELVRPLVVDPMQARRLRYRRDGLRKPARRP